LTERFLRRGLWGMTALLLLLPGGSSTAVEHGSESLPISSDLRVVVLRGRDVALEIKAHHGDDYATIAERISNSPDGASALAAWNHETDIEEGVWIQIPVALLSDEYRSLALRTLFPRDRLDGQDWVHLSRSGELPTYDEGLWQIAVWFTAGGSTFDDLRRTNRLGSPELRGGQEVRIPRALLHPAFRARARSEDGSLAYDTDESGPFAAYHLKPGEAIYSGVVVRFTGRTADEDVDELAARIAARSDVADPTDIPAGYEIKIPLDLLEAEFLPAGHPRRLEMEVRRSELERELASAPPRGPRRGLEGVLVILDPGHGGRDMGTIHNGIWEHDYVYDVACRLKQSLEAETTARVYMTLEDMETGCAPSRSDRLVANQQGTILTAPPFLARREGEAKIGVNLRWYLANSIYRKALREGIDSDRVVFLSLHADSRHPSLRGLMVYVPGADYRTRTYGPSASVYRKYGEVREKPHIKFSKKERLRSEAVSRELAGDIVSSFRVAGLPIQPHQPVRDKVIRGDGKWVPAVLRGNAVPNKVLVEMVNIGNREDAELLGSARQRENLSLALLNAVRAHFGETPRSAGAVATAD
jgi:N-acetylmuramoyl-L-alanine amidase